MKMEKERIYKILSNIVGREFISDEPEICIAYSQDHGTRGLPSRKPDYVVLPANTNEVQRIVAVAKRYKVPITIQTTGINTAGHSNPSQGGILIDLKRMNKIIKIDEEHMTATIEPYVSIARLSSECQKRGMFIAVSGAPSTAGVMSNYLWGDAHKATQRLGFLCQQIVGFEIVLPDGTLLKVGSGSDPFVGEDFWPHGPGPDFQLLARWANGAYGIVTKMTVKCWPLDKEFKPFWVAFDDVDNAVGMHNELIRMEICTGFSLYSGCTYNSYSTDHPEAQYRMNRAHPEFMLILTLQGTRRRVEYEEKVVRELAKKHAGRIITDTLPFYQAFVDSHISMAGSLYSEYTMRYWGSRGKATIVIFPTTIDKIGLAFKTISKCVLKIPELADPDYVDGYFGRSMISYAAEGGHYSYVEYAIEGFTSDPKSRLACNKLNEMLSEELPKIGIQPISTAKFSRFNIETGSYGYYRELARKFKRELDPDNFMQPGQVFG